MGRYGPVDVDPKWTAYWAEQKRKEKTEYKQEYKSGFTDSGGTWHGSTIDGQGMANPYGAASGSNYSISFDYPKETEVSEQEYIVGDGKTKSFTFPTTEKYPAVIVYTRVVEGEGSEQTVTVTVSDAEIAVVQSENITVTFLEAPARRGAVVLIG